MSLQPIHVIFYDGIVSQPRQAKLYAWNKHSVQIEYQDHGTVEKIYTYKDMTLIGALGQIHPVIELNDDARIEFSEPLPAWFDLDHKNKNNSIWKLERSPSLILFSVIFVAAFAFATVKWGIPTAAYQVAKYLPADTLKSIGDQAEDYLMNATAPSQLPQARQDKITADYQKLFGQQKPAKILFRQGDSIGANALAIPNNTILLTDELVKLAADDREIIGVLAHEQGHLAERHSLQQAISSLGFSAIVILITGDASDLITTVPVAMIGSSYSRDFEAEADQYALKTMYQHQIPPQYFAQFLERLAKHNGEQDENEKSILEFLSSHPATKDRIQAVKDFEMQHQGH